MMPSRKDRFRKISAEAREQTNEALAEETAALPHLTREEVARLLPSSDRAQFAALMAILAEATDENEKISALKDNIEDVGGVVVRVLELLR